MKYYPIISEPWNYTDNSPFLSKDIHIWIADLNIEHTDLYKYYKFLSSMECKRTNLFKFEQDRCFFVVAKGILRIILSNYLTVAPETIEFMYNDFGKPYLAQNNSDNLFFNLSYSENLALYIFSSFYEVGIDLERIRPVNNIEEIAELFFSSGEIADLKNIPLPQRKQGFYKCWTRKEAFIKAIGFGLSYPLHRFQVSLLPKESCRLIQINGDYSAASLWSLNEIRTSVDYEAAYAYKGHCASIKYYKFTKCKKSYKNLSKKELTDQILNFNFVQKENNLWK